MESLNRRFCAVVNPEMEVLFSGRYDECIAYMQDQLKDARLDRVFSDAFDNGDQLPIDIWFAEKCDGMICLKDMASFSL